MNFWGFKMTERRAELLLLTVGILWGFGFISTGMLLTAGMGPFTLVGIRFIIAVIFLSAIYYKRLKIKKGEIGRLMIIGMALYFGFAGQTMAMNYTSTTNVSFITGLNIVFVPFAAYFISNKKIEMKNIIAAIIAMAGLYFLTGGMQGLATGDILALFGAFCFAIHIGLIGKYAKDIDIIKLAVWQMFFCSVLGFITAFVINEPVIYSISTMNIWVALFTGLFPSALCFLGQNVGLKYTDEAKGSLILATESLWGAIFAIILLGEAFGINIIYGSILMILAIVIDELKFNKLKIMVPKKSR